MGTKTLLTISTLILGMRLIRSVDRCWDFRWAVPDATTTNTIQSPPLTTMHSMALWKVRSGHFLAEKNRSVLLVSRLSCLPMKSQDWRKRRLKSLLNWIMKSPYLNVSDQSLIQTYWPVEWILASKLSRLESHPANRGSVPAPSKSLPTRKVRSIIFTLQANWAFGLEAGYPTTGCDTSSKTACGRRLTG